MTATILFILLLSSWRVAAAPHYFFALRLDSPIPGHENDRPYLTLGATLEAYPGSSDLNIDFADHLDKPDKSFYIPDSSHGNAGLAYSVNDKDQRYLAYQTGPTAGYSASLDSPLGMSLITDPAPDLKKSPAVGAHGNRWNFVKDIGFASNGAAIDLVLKRDKGGSWYACGPQGGPTPGPDPKMPGVGIGGKPGQMFLHWAKHGEEKDFAPKLKTMGIICHAIKIRLA